MKDGVFCLFSCFFYFITSNVLKYNFILIFSICREYFQNGGKRKALEKDEKRAVLATKTTPALTVHESAKLEGRLTNLSFTSPEFITE